MKGNNDDSIKVFVRVRPFNNKQTNTGSCIDKQTETAIKLKDRERDNQKDKQKQGQLFTFDKVFGPQCTQEQVYEKVGREAVNSAFEGFNGTIFAYGQTSSGKTHTCIGPDYTDQQKKGILPRLIDQIFFNISQAPTYIEFRIKISMVEIYMQKIKDLLDINKSDLKIRESKAKGIYIQDVTQQYVSSSDETISIIKKGINNRTVGQTNMNDVSSRSHMAFIITLYQNDLKDLSAKSGKIILVDLAGSQKISKTGAEGKLLDEAKQINKSLSALGNVINALTEQKVSHIPYRDSKLTRLLQESLGGNSKTNLIINISPSIINHSQGLSSIRFGIRAKQIKNKPKVNKQYTVAELLLLLEKAEKKNQQLEQIIKQLTNSSGKKKSVIKKEQSVFVENLLDSDNPILLSQAQEIENQLKKNIKSKQNEVRFDTQYQYSDDSLQDKQLKKPELEQSLNNQDKTYDQKMLLVEEIETLNQEKTAMYRQYQIIKDKYEVLLREAKFSQSKVNSQKRENQKLIERLTSQQILSQQKQQKIQQLSSQIQKYQQSLNKLSQLYKTSAVSKGFGPQILQQANQIIFDALSINQKHSNFYQELQKKELANESQDLAVSLKKMQDRVKILEQQLSMYAHLQQSKQILIKQKLELSNERLRMHQDLENRIQKVLQLQQKLDQQLDKNKYLQKIIDSDESQKGRKIISLQAHLAEVSENYYVLKGQQSSWMKNNEKVEKKLKEKSQKILQLEREIMSLKQDLQMAKLRIEQVQEHNQSILDVGQIEQIRKQPTIVKVLKSSSIKVG